MNAQVVTVTSKGQISLPVNIRNKLSIEKGDSLVIYATEDAIILKTLKLPSNEEFESALLEAKSWAASVGYKEKDANDIIKSVRKNKNNYSKRIL